MELKGYQRSYLSRKAHSLKPVVMVGQKGLTEEVLKAIDKALDDHEMIKVKFYAYKEIKDKIAPEVCNAMEATLVRIIGNIAIYYRHQQDNDKRWIHLPK